jgi:hypothetical protein
MMGAHVGEMIGGRVMRLTNAGVGEGSSVEKIGAAFGAGTGGVEVHLHPLSLCQQQLQYQFQHQASWGALSSTKHVMMFCYCVALIDDHHVDHDLLLSSTHGLSSKNSFPDLSFGIILATIFCAFDQPGIAACFLQAMYDASERFLGKNRILVGVYKCHITSPVTDQSCMWLIHTPRSLVSTRLLNTRHSALHNTIYFVWGVGGMSKHFGTNKLWSTLYKERQQ